ncbi:MAG: DUF4331 domain-containing protein [Chitinophagaceae bacterium]
MNKTQTLLKRWGITALALGFTVLGHSAFASSHREAPLIAQDPQADNTDVYAFRSPDDTNTITLIANYIPFQLPEGGPNYYTFGSDVRYEIHVKNNSATAGDDITYRFTFSVNNEDTTTFFNIRLGKRNQRVTYRLQRIINGGTAVTIVANGQVPPPNIGPRSINGAAGLNFSGNYDSLINNSIATATTGEKVYAGPADDPFFADLAGIFDLGGFRPAGNSANPTKDGLSRFNVSTICIKVPIKTLQQSGQDVTHATSILDPKYVIGVWASASRRLIRTFNGDGTVTLGGTVGFGGGAQPAWVQVSRLGMPLTNEAIIPIGGKDKWNALNPTDGSNNAYFNNFNNPELALYMDASQYGSAVPALNALRIQKASRPDIGPFDFRNGHKGLYNLKGSSLVSGTALDDANYGNLLLPDSMSPRAVDLFPIFNTGVPNTPPYQLATGKGNVPSTTKMNPLSQGKPFINNFLPALGDMLRLNMAVPVTPRNSPDFSSEGLIKAAVLGLTDPRFNTDKSLQFIPNMDGFPNGRRLEDDVTTIELQAVGGVVLAAIGLWFDDYNGTGDPVTPALLRNLGFTAGPTKNDTTFKASFPYVATPWRGFDYSPQARF